MLPRGRDRIGEVRRFGVVAHCNWYGSPYLELLSSTVLGHQQTERFELPALENLCTSSNNVRSYSRNQISEFTYGVCNTVVLQA